ncbi:MAG TPA: hypothetical protein VF182_06365 [Candidatus Binatia bacterium]
MNVDKLPAGHELDALTAERVFGWKDIARREHQPWGKRKDKGGRWRAARVPDYSTDPTYAADIEERMHELGLSTQYRKELAKASRAKNLPTDWAPPDQRCRAAIKAIKSKAKLPSITNKNREIL